jgi:hypothetical protein
MQLKKIVPPTTAIISHSHSSSGFQLLALRSAFQLAQGPQQCSLTTHRQRSRFGRLLLQVLLLHCRWCIFAPAAAAAALAAAVSCPAGLLAAAARHFEWPKRPPSQLLCLCNLACRCCGNAACLPACCIQPQRQSILAWKALGLNCEI